MGQLTILTGNLTDEVRWNAAGENDAVNFTVVTNESFKKKGETEYTNVPTYHRCTRFVPKGAGEKLAARMTKGRHVEVVGQVQTGKPREGLNRAQETKTFRNKFVRVDELKFVGAAKEQAPAA